jgi:hypothetical protein
MAAVAKSGTPSLCSATPSAESQIPGLLAGAAIAAGDACYINADGRAYPATGAAANAAARTRGFASAATTVGEAVTIYRNVRFHYGAGLTPGADYYLSGAVAGGLDTVASVGGTAAIAYAVDATRIQIINT